MFIPSPTTVLDDFLSRAQHPDDFDSHYNWFDLDPKEDSEE